MSTPVRPADGLLLVDAHARPAGEGGAFAGGDPTRVGAVVYLPVDALLGGLPGAGAPSGVSYAWVASASNLSLAAVDSMVRCLEQRMTPAVHLAWEHAPGQPDHKRLDPILAALRRADVGCVIDVASAHLQEVLAIVHAHGDLRFALAAMGRPAGINTLGFSRWWSNVKALSLCENVVIEIAALPSIFGPEWTDKSVTPWILSAIEMFGTRRVMFGSDLPLDAAEEERTATFATYRRITRGFSLDEQDDLFRGVAWEWFRMA